MKVLLRILRARQRPRSAILPMDRQTERELATMRAHREARAGEDQLA